MPRFTHDCDDCVYQGFVGKYDAYYCPTDPGGPMMVYRFSDDGPDYLSKDLKTKVTTTYIVWVGGVEVARHKCREAAEVTVASWRKDGYSDVAIEEENNA